MTTAPDVTKVLWPGKYVWFWDIEYIVTSVHFEPDGEMEMSFVQSGKRRGIAVEPATDD